MATKKYVMLADAQRCVNCQACTVACRAEWNTPLGHSRNWISEIMTIADDGAPRLSLVSGRCQHCDDAPCVEYCPSGASYKREDGLVLLDREICSGCEICISVCPYDARFKDPTDGKISKCTFCQPRIDAGRKPACVEVCFNHALIFGDANDPDSQVSKLLAKGGWKQLVTDEVNTRPSHYYPADIPMDDAILPKKKSPPLSVKLMEDAVNPALTFGLGGMAALFGAAGLMKLIKRREEERDDDGND